MLDKPDTERASELVKAPDFGPDLLDPVTTILGFFRLYGMVQTLKFVAIALERMGRRSGVAHQDGGGGHGDRG